MCLLLLLILLDSLVHNFYTIWPFILFLMSISSLEGLTWLCCILIVKDLHFFEGLRLFFIFSAIIFSSRLLFPITMNFSYIFHQVLTILNLILS